VVETAQSPARVTMNADSIGCLWSSDCPDNLSGIAAMVVSRKVGDNRVFQTRFRSHRKARAMKLPLPQRRGQRPETTETNPRRQLTQNAPEELQEALWERMAGLPNIDTGPSLVSVPGARAIFICSDCAGGPPSSFIKAREFGHIHPVHDGSIHITLPEHVRDEALDKGWVEPHPLAARNIVPASVVMVYGPRDPQELEVVWALVQESQRFASGAAGGRSVLAV